MKHQRSFTLMVVQVLGQDVRQRVVERTAVFTRGVPEIAAASHCAIGAFGKGTAA